MPERDADDSQATPIEVPHPNLTRKSFPELQLQTNGVHPPEPSVPFPREMPALEPLPLRPTPLDVAVRYGDYANFVQKWWPVLHDRLALVDKLQRTVDDLLELVETLRAELRIRRTGQWVWPLACGFLLATTIGALFIRR